MICGSIQFDHPRCSFPCAIHDAEWLAMEDLERNRDHQEAAMANHTVSKNYWILTRGEFLMELEAELEETRRRRIAKYDRGAKKYGENVNLFDRDFEEEGRDEQTDRENYRLFDRVFKRRRSRLQGAP